MHQHADVTPENALILEFLLVQILDFDQMMWFWIMVNQSRKKK